MEIGVEHVRVWMLCDVLIIYLPSSRKLHTTVTVESSPD